MANVRISALTARAANPALDDFYVIDGTANGTRKLPASATSPNYSVQFNKNGLLSGDNIFTFNPTTSGVGLTGNMQIVGGYTYTASDMGLGFSLKPRFNADPTTQTIQWGPYLSLNSNSLSANPLGTQFVNYPVEFRIYNEPQASADPGRSIPSAFLNIHQYDSTGTQLGGSFIYEALSGLYVDRYIVSDYGFESYSGGFASQGEAIYTAANDIGGNFGAKIINFKKTGLSYMILGSAGPTFSRINIEQNKGLSIKTGDGNAFTGLTAASGMFTKGLEVYGTTTLSGQNTYVFGLLSTNGGTISNTVTARDASFATISASTINAGTYVNAASYVQGLNLRFTSDGVCLMNNNNQNVAYASNYTNIIAGGRAQMSWYGPQVFMSPVAIGNVGFGAPPVLSAYLVLSATPAIPFYNLALSALGNVTVTGTVSANTVSVSGAGGRYLSGGQDLFALFSNAPGSTYEKWDVSFDGQGTTLTSASAYRAVDKTGTILAGTLIGDVAGSVTVTVTRYTPSGGALLGTMAQLGTLSLSTAQYSRDTTLAGWTTSVTAGDVLVFGISSITSLTKLTVNLTT